MLYTKESDQKHGHKYEHPQEYCVEKRDGTLFLDVIRSNYELREWRFGRDILGKAMENAFIANTDIELYNTLIVRPNFLSCEIHSRARTLSLSLSLSLLFNLTIIIMGNVSDIDPRKGRYPSGHHGRFWLHGH